MICAIYLKYLRIYSGKEFHMNIRIPIHKYQRITELSLHVLTNTNHKLVVRLANRWRQLGQARDTPMVETPMVVHHDEFFIVPTILSSLTLYYL